MAGISRATAMQAGMERTRAASQQLERDIIQIAC